eukprot:7217307-Pyramimonas_sp.AAC.1
MLKATCSPSVNMLQTSSFKIIHGEGVSGETPWPAQPTRLGVRRGGAMSRETGWKKRRRRRCSLRQAGPSRE